MNPELYNGIIILMGAIIAALLFVVFKNSTRLADSVPQPVFVLLANLLLPILKGYVVGAVEKTPTELDDEVVSEAIKLLETFLELYGKNVPATPPEPSPPAG